MSENLLTGGNGELKNNRFLLETYFRRDSQAELTVPYSFPTDADETLFGAIFKSRMHRYLIDIDGPWIYAFALSSMLCYIMAFICMHAGVPHQLAVASSVIMWPAVLFPCYWTIAGMNFRLRYGRRWLRTILGPTHLGLSATGIKCYWKGKFIYNYPLLRSWPNVRQVELYWQRPDDLLGQANIFFSFAGRLTVNANMRLPIKGFQSRAQLLALLNYLDKHLPESARGEGFKQDSAKGFERTLAQFDESKRWEIELSK